MLAIIPARGGSKGLPGKNIKLFAGKPLIAYTIEAAKKSSVIDKIVVSTNDPQIANIAKKFGADVPFLRPKKLSEDNSKMIDVLVYTLDKLTNHEDCAVLLPTNPLRIDKDITGAIDLFKKKKAKSVVAMVEWEHPISWARTLDKNNKVKPYCLLDLKTSNDNRQKLVKTYRPNSMFILKHSVLKKEYTYYTNRTYGYIMPKERSIDIDDLLDFKIAEFIFMEQNAKNRQI